MAKFILKNQQLGHVALLRSAAQKALAKKTAVLNLLTDLVNLKGGVYFPFQETANSVAEAVNPAVALGRELVINGDFASDTVWVKGTGWTIAAGVASCDGSQIAGSVLYQASVIEPNKTYEFTFALSNYSAGTVRAGLGGTSLGTLRSANNTYTETITGGTSNSTIALYADVDFIGDIDNVSVKQTNIAASTAFPGAQLLTDGGLENWSSATDLTSWAKTIVGTSTVNRDTSVRPGSSGTYSARLDVDSSNNVVAIYQTNVLTIGRKYTVSFWAKADIASGVSAILQDQAGNSLGVAQNLSAVYTQYTQTITATATGIGIKRNVAANQSIYIDDVSVREANPLNGDITGATIDQDAGLKLRKSYLFDGTNDFVDIYSSEINSIFDPTKGTLLSFAKVSGAGVWTDGVGRRVITLQSDTDNLIRIAKPTTNNLMLVDYEAGNVPKTQNISVTTTDWFLIALTWDTVADEVKAYLNGVQIGSTLTGLGTWVGNLTSTTVNIGALATTPTNPWDGFITHSVLLAEVLTGEEIQNIAITGDII